jgi:FAD/FMN-containing dehydrogenase
MNRGTADLDDGDRTQVVARGDDEYEAARGVFNVRLMRQPALIHRCRTAEDVRVALRVAHERGLGIAVRAGGHSHAGWSSIEDGLVIDLTSMRSIEIDAETSTAWVGGGTLAMDLVQAAARFGLAPVVGTTATVGIAGLLLGLGEGYLSAKHGFGTDNILELRVVTADGTIQTVSATSHPDLFWAMRGAGANFGVVTAFKLQLHPLPARAIRGRLTFVGDEVRPVTDHIWEVLHRGSPHYFPMVCYERDDGGQASVRFMPGHTGPAEEAELDLRRLREAASPSSDTTAPCSYPELIGAGIERARTVCDVYRFAFDGDLEAQKDLLLGLHAALPRFGQVWLWRTVPIVPSSAVGVAPRLPGITVGIAGTWHDPREDEEYLRWIRETSTTMVDSELALVASNTINHVHEIGPERIRRLYGDDYTRLAALKAVVDPENVFRSNANIPPA